MGLLYQERLGKEQTSWLPLSAEYKETLKDDLNIFSGLIKCADCGKGTKPQEIRLQQFPYDLCMRNLCHLREVIECTQHKNF